MAGDQLPNLVLPTVTKRGHHTKSTKRLTCVDPYQMLPRSMLAVRNPVVFLDWSTNAYHPSDLALFAGMATFTKHHRLVKTIGIIDCYNVLILGTVIDCG